MEIRANDLLKALQTRWKLVEHILKTMGDQPVDWDAFTRAISRHKDDEVKSAICSILLRNKDKGATERELCKGIRPFARMPKHDRAQLLESMAQDGLIRMAEMRFISGRSRKAWFLT